MPPLPSRITQNCPKTRREQTTGLCGFEFNLGSQTPNTSIRAPELLLPNDLALAPLSPAFLRFGDGDSGQAQPSGFRSHPALSPSRLSHSQVNRGVWSTGRCPRAANATLRSRDQPRRPVDGSPSWTHSELWPVEPRQFSASSRLRSCRRKRGSTSRNMEGGPNCRRIVFTASARRIEILHQPDIRLHFCYVAEQSGAVVAADSVIDAAAEARHGPAGRQTSEHSWTGTAEPSMSDTSHGPRRSRRFQ